MNNLRRNLPGHLQFLALIFGVMLALFTLSRVITLLVNRPQYVSESPASAKLWEAFQIGAWFDAQVASWALLLPFLLLTCVYFGDWTNRRWLLFVRVYCCFVIAIALAICAADVPYFSFFNSRLTVIAVNFKNLGQNVAFILREPKYWPSVFIGIAGIWGIVLIVNKLWAVSHRVVEHRVAQKLTFSGFGLLVLLIGIWGKSKPSEPSMSSASFSRDGFVNQLALNPVYTWFDSYFDFDINFLPLETAKAHVAKIFGGYPAQQTPSPIAKHRSFVAPARKMNVVLVLMESMSADRMGIFGNPRNLTPGLDSLCRNSIFFDRHFSNGIHTNAGIYSSIFGMPIRMMEHPMNNPYSEKATFSGLPTTLRAHGYRTEFFCTHAKSFDNLDLFLSKNGFDEISDVRDYPDSTVTNVWGVSDETLFQHAHEQLNKLASDSTGRPFFATILTISAHPPYTIPKFTKFKPRSTDAVELCYEYADWSLKNFMDSVAAEPWYRNTIFVFVGDHGCNIPGPFDVPLSYNHVPLIFHAPGIFSQGKTRHDLANQTDIFPTVMGLLRLPYEQNTLGFDLFREKRPFAIFSQDTKMGVLNEHFLYIARKSGKPTLFEFGENFGQDILKNNRALADSMKIFACSQLQVAEWMIREKLVE